MKKVRIGVLGCSHFAKRYGMPAFRALPNAELVSVASRDYKKAKEWASEFSIFAEESYDALILNKEIDAVHVPLPNSLHKEWIIKAAKAGKHVICEKSISGNYNDVKEIVDVCRENNVVLYENFMCGFHPQNVAVQTLLSQKEIGEPFVMRSFFGFPMIDENNFRYSKVLDGGVLNENGAYSVFMARHLFQKDPISVSASVKYKNGVDISGTVMLDFDEGVSAVLSFSIDAVYQNNYTVWGTKGLVEVKRAYSIPPTMVPEVEIVANENMQEIRKKLDIPAANHFELIFSDFCTTIIEGDTKKQFDSYEKILSQAKVLEAVRIASKENRKVFLEEIK